MKNILSILCCLVPLLTGCSNSLLFSPALNAPTSYLKKDQVQLYGGSTMLVETRPSLNEDRKSLRIGADGGVRFAFSNNVSGQVRTWIGDVNRWGVSFGSWIRLSDTSSSMQFALVPTFGAAFYANRIDGKGIGISAVLLKQTSVISPYLALTPMYGWNDDNFLVGKNNGAGVSTCIGASVGVFSGFAVNTEMNAVILYSNFSHDVSFVMSPSLMMHWTL